MIVAMKKATVIARQQEKQEALNRLRRLGVLHLSAVPAQVAPAQEWREKKELLEKALASLFPASARAEAAVGVPAPETHLDAVIDAARSILEARESLRGLDEERANIEKEAARLAEWQGISVSELRSIRDGGYEVRFFEVPPRQLKLIPPEHNPFVVRRGKTLLWVALVVKTGTVLDHEFKPLHPPRHNVNEIEDLRSQNRSEQQRLRLELDRLGAMAGELERAAHAAAREVELAEAAAAMGHSADLCYLAGFLPEDRVQDLRQFCRDNRWALLLQEPAAEDDVPTIVRNRRWIDIIRPVFQLLGTVPGYREIDISFFFLMFFAFFFAVIIGDAGYGLVLLSATLFFIIRTRRRGRELPNALLLMLLLGLGTVLWGALTGTWFGSRTLASLPWLSWMTIPAISSFNPRSSETIKIICFITGTIHIAIAHIWNFIRQARQKPFIRSLAQLGWLALVLGLYYLVLGLVLSSERFPLPAFAAWLIGAGLAMIIVFSRQEGRFFHGIVMGVSNLLTTFLSGISAFSDIISYIRLFAVGLATVEIAKSFNSMAAGMAHGVLGIILASLVLLLGHSLNLAMGALSVVVHGVRLNMLEFSGHLGMEWTGRPYKPFKE
ncbi:MAG: V-type ATP synthase subunit I [Acidobacteria bacterium]|jgi:V/A-type H+-transporting ATPase subunit I|nr:V-type ATP synthase subunit I [Acidobacteriota bacterium]